MKRHLTTEQLSSYLDGEIGSPIQRQIEAHLASCPACRARRDAMERVVVGLRRVDRPSAPPALAQAVRRRIAAAQEQPPSLLRRLQQAFSDLTLRPAFRTSAAMGLAMLFSVYLLSHGLGHGQHAIGPAEETPADPVVSVQTYFGEPPLHLPPTTSEVAGREFILSGNRWIQRGLEGKKPEAYVHAGSPEGRAMLSKYSDLEFLLADGTPVVLRYRLETVEISGRS